LDYNPLFGNDISMVDALVAPLVGAAIAGVVYAAIAQEPRPAAQARRASA